MTLDALGALAFTAVLFTALIGLVSVAGEAAWHWLKTRRKSRAPGFVFCRDLGYTSLIGKTPLGTN